MMRVLVTGAAGFVGRYMCDYLARLENRPEIIGTDVVDCTNKICDRFVQIDLSSANDLANLVAQTTPDYVIHFAGLFGSDDMQQIYRANVLSTTSLLEAIRLHKSDAVIVMAGSAAEYGEITAEQLPVIETMSCQPITAYGLSKLLATQVSLYYHRVYGLNVMIVRPFQLIGKGVTSRLAPGAFADQFKRAISDGSNVIKVGNLESSRDFLDVRDAVIAIWMLCQKPSAGQIFNICSGKPVKMAELLRLMIAASGVNVEVEIDPARIRGACDVSVVYGSNQKINSHCDWKPKTTLTDCIKDMYK
jgi:GDP-4-dehydro-6-deoxy-D-mannose reductase